MSALDATQVLAIGILAGSDDDPLRSGCNLWRILRERWIAQTTLLMSILSAIQFAINGGSTYYRHSRAFAYDVSVAHWGGTNKTRTL